MARWRGSPSTPTSPTRWCLRCWPWWRWGIAEAPGYELRFYSTDDLPRRSYVDTERIAHDAERFLGIPRAVADKVFEVELAFMEMRGLAYWWSPKCYGSPSKASRTGGRRNGGRDRLPTV
jgi:hypothetical protein